MKDKFFYQPLPPMIDSFSGTPFLSEHRFFNNAVTSVAEYCDDITVAFDYVITCSDVNLNHGIHDVHNQCISTCENSHFLSYPG